MPSRETLRNFIDVVVSGRHDHAIELFYAEDASMQENLEEMRKGRALLVEREQQVMSMFEEIRTTCIEPVFIEGDKVVINWIFEFVAPNGPTRLMNEIAVQHWQGDKILRERFYYDPVRKHHAGRTRKRRRSSHGLSQTLGRRRQQAVRPPRSA